MRKLVFKYVVLCAFACTVSCTPPDDTPSYTTYSCGVLSSNVESYSTGELILKIRYFVLDGAESNQLIAKNIENSLELYSSDVAGTLIDNKEVTTPSAGNYTCAVLLDEGYNIINYDFLREISSTEGFLRKFFKNPGNNNSFLLSSFQTTTPVIRFYGKGYTKTATELDLPMAGMLNNVNEPNELLRKSTLLQNIDILLDTINKAAEGSNRNLLLIYSRASFLVNKVSRDSVINKAKRLKIKVSTILDKGGEYYIDYELNNEDFFFKMADITGGFVYKDNDYTQSFDKLILASRLGNILEGNFKCFESTWKVVPKGIWTEAFQTGFYAEGNLEIDLGTQYLTNVIEFPFCVYIK